MKIGNPKLKMIVFRGSLIIVDGDGAREGAVNWLKKVCNEKKYCDASNNKKTITGFNFAEFMIWANKQFR